MHFAYKKGQVTIIRHAAIIILAIGVFGFIICCDGFSEEKSHLAEGIKLYYSGLYNEALNEFRTEIKIHEHCPLAYY